MKNKSIYGIVTIFLIAAAVAGYAFFYGNPSAAVTYRTARVERGSLSSQVTANGTVNPVITVLVGSQVSGRIQNLYADYNTPVKKGQLIAQIDPATFQAQVSQIDAKVQNANASILNAEADIGAARSNLDVSKANVVKAAVAVADTRRNLDRNRELFSKNLIAASENDAAQTAYDSALAQLEAVKAQQHAAEAQLESFKARLISARAALKQVESELEIVQLNLNYTRITAPVNGIVISRDVDVGQTVAASLQAPTLFTIAQDLTDMQVEVNVSEADIGRIAEGQETTFTVDAFPQDVFRGRVTEIRNSPITVQNVVSYIVVIRVKNPEMKLRPGMTANASIRVAHRDEVLKIPNSVLRFRPEFAKQETETAAGKKSGVVSPSARATTTGPRNFEKLLAALNLTPDQQEKVSRILKDTPRLIDAAGGDPEKTRTIRQESRLKIRELLTESQMQKLDQMARQGEDRRAPAPVFKVWVPVSQQQPVPVEITTGISDGVFTEVLSGDLREGQEVIAAAGSSAKNTKNSPSAGPPGFGGRR